jgi:acyl carrier protein
MTIPEFEKILAEILTPEGDGAKETPIPLSEGDMDKTLDELQVDSLARAELIIALDDKYGISISDEDAKNLTTPRLVVDFVNAQAA